MNDSLRGPGGAGRELNVDGVVDIQRRAGGIEFSLVDAIGRAREFLPERK